MWRKWLYRFQEFVGITERECQTIMILVGLLVLGSSARLFTKSSDLYDDAYYAELDAEFERLVARSDSFEASLVRDPEEEDVDTGNPEGLDLNKATADQLVLLPRIGPTMAQRILSVRRQIGRFEYVSDLLLVNGIGEKTLEVLKGLVTVVPDTSQGR